MADIRDLARSRGLDRLSEAHLEQLARAIAAMERHLQRLPRDLPPAQEMALIYRAKGPTE
jgi:Tfp pilus assembly protein PilO